MTYTERARALRPYIENAATGYKLGFVKAISHPPFYIFVVLVT